MLWIIFHITSILIELTHFLPMSTFVTVLLIFYFKKEGTMEKNSYERRAYESVDDKIIYILGYISKTDGKKVLGCNGLIKYI